MSKKLNGKAKQKARAIRLKKEQLRMKSRPNQIGLNEKNVLFVIKEVANIIIDKFPNITYSGNGHGKEGEEFFWGACRTLIKSRPGAFTGSLRINQLKKISLDFTENTNKTYGCSIGSGWEDAYGDDVEGKLSKANVPQLKCVMMGVLDTVGGMAYMKETA